MITRLGMRKYKFLLVAVRGFQDPSPIHGHVNEHQYVPNVRVHALSVNSILRTGEVTSTTYNLT